MRLRECAILSKLLRALRISSAQTDIARSVRTEALTNDVTNSIRRRIAIFSGGIVVGLLLAAVALMLRHANEEQGPQVATLIGNGVDRHGEALDAWKTLVPDAPHGCVECPGRARHINADGSNSPNPCTEAPSEAAACAFFVKG